MSSLKALLLIPAIAGLMACQPLPQPFQADARTKATSPLVRPIGETSIFVLPVAALPGGQGAALADALADALTEKEVAASATARSRLSSTLAIGLEPRGGDTLWHWTESSLDDGRQQPGGKPLGVAFDRLAAGDAGSLKQAAAIMAAAIADRLNETTIAAAQGAGSTPARLAVRECEGAPGDGNRSLRQAMREILILGGQTLLPDVSGADLVITCNVQVWADGPASERVAIEWALLGADGSRLGDVKQANRIPKGQLSQAWGNTAHIIAQGGWQGLSQIIDTRRRTRPALPPTKS
ncbi:MAG: hypothetical protein ACK4FK_01100 [Ferrovibrio sp.]|uniref:hypothetical protein n=1 Tax=Ferrovibrio sp. TaxID=1917215 RepID=UPI00391A5539